MGLHHLLVQIEGGSIALSILGMNFRDSEPAELATFITVTSDFPRRHAGSRRLDSDSDP
jgi:hypothetical protein